MMAQTVVRIGKRFGFEAAHHLPALPEGHPCARRHGHSYTVEVILEGATTGLVPPGFVTDFAELAPLRRYLDEAFDHRDLNEVVAFPPTSELLACHLLEWCQTHLLPHLPARHTPTRIRVRVGETRSCWAEADAEVDGEVAAS